MLSFLLTFLGGGGREVFQLRQAHSKRNGVGEICQGISVGVKAQGISVGEICQGISISKLPSI